MLLDSNADANIADNSGLTPLHVAAHRGTKDMATLLLERDAHIDAIDKVVCNYHPPVDYISYSTVPVHCIMPHSKAIMILFPS